MRLLSSLYGRIHWSSLVQPYKLIIFDWDGTILDSIGLIVESVHKAAFDCHLPRLDDQTVKDIIGLRLDVAILKLYPHLSKEALAIFLEKYAIHYLAMEKDAIRLYPTVLSTLEELKKQGFLVAVATGKKRNGLDRILTILELTEFFDATRCADETAGKPDPKMLNELLAEFNLTSEQALMVGDASFDLQMAHNANMDCVAVSYGAQQISVLEQHHPKLIINQLDELLKYLKID